MTKPLFRQWFRRYTELKPWKYLKRKLFKSHKLREIWKKNSNHAFLNSIYSLHIQFYVTKLHEFYNFSKNHLWDPFWKLSVFLRKQWFSILPRQKLELTYEYAKPIFHSMHHITRNSNIELWLLSSLINLSSSKLKFVKLNAFHQEQVFQAKVLSFNSSFCGSEKSRYANKWFFLEKFP